MVRGQRAAFHGLAAGVDKGLYMCHSKFPQTVLGSSVSGLFKLKCLLGTENAKRFEEDGDDGCDLQGGFHFQVKRSKLG